MLDRTGVPTYLVQGLVRADGITIWSAPPSTGKTYALVDLACHIAAGLDEWHGLALSPRGRQVAFLVGEDAASWAGRVASWCAHHPEHASEVEKNILGLFPTLLHMGGETTPDVLLESLPSGWVSPALWIVDPLTAFLLDLDENDARQARAVMHNLGALASRSRAPVLVAAHKARRGLKGAGPKGAVEFSGMASHLAELTMSKTGFVTIAATKDRLGLDTPTSLSLRLTGLGVLGLVPQVGIKAAPRPGKTKKLSAKSKALAYLKANPGLEAEKIASAIGVKSRTVSNELSKLKGEKAAHNIGTKWFPGPVVAT